MSLRPDQRKAYLSQVGRAISRFETDFHLKIARTPGMESAAFQMSTKDLFAALAWLPEASAEEDTSGDLNVNQDKPGGRRPMKVSGQSQNSNRADADQQEPSCSGDTSEAARSYRKKPALWHGDKPACLIGGMPSTYVGDKPVRNGCVTQTQIGGRDVCTDNSVPKPRTVCNPLFACKSDLRIPLCVQAKPNAFQTCLDTPGAAHDKCVVEGSPDADYWREMTEALKEICENNENGKKFFCMECSKLKTALAAADTTLPAPPPVPMPNVPPGGESGARRN